MATIKDVAKLAGVSVSTVSKYLNGGNVRPENQPAIREAIAALDYRVNPFARGLKAQRNRSVGILLPDKVDLKLTECAAAVKGNTATNALKNAVTETGLEVKVPLFIEEGEVITVSTIDGKYSGRA